MAKDYDKALTRLISILSKLHFDERPTILELASEFNVSKRTIQYDLYNRLISYPISKDDIGRLKFEDDFTLIDKVCS